MDLVTNGIKNNGFILFFVFFKKSPKQIVFLFSLMFFLVLQGCSSVVIPEEDSRPFFNAELAKKYREEIAKIDRNALKRTEDCIIK